jgi:predicted DNA-binding transcriptional regulator YafY
MFTDLEAGSLALGAEHIARTADAPFGPAARSARAKLGSALTAERPRDIRSVQDSITSAYPDAAPVHRSLQVLRDAIFGRQVLAITYHAFGRPHAEYRIIEPYGLVHFGQAWQLLAFCRQRQAPHLFRLDRIDQVSADGDQAESLDRERYDGLPDDSVGAGEMLAVRVAARVLGALLQDRPCGPADQQADGAFTILRFDASDPERLLRWLMQWAGDVEVIAPPRLRRRIATLGELVAAAHSGDFPSADLSLFGSG